MTLIVHVFSVADSMENVLALCKWTGEVAKANGFRHIADPDRQPEEADNQVTECQIACLTLYPSHHLYDKHLNPYRA